MKKGTQLYKTYLFKDKDPIIDHMRTIIDDHHTRYAKVSEVSGVSTATLYNWFNGATKRPQYATVMAVVRSFGYDLQIVKTNSHERDYEIIKHQRSQPKPKTKRKTTDHAHA